MRDVLTALGALVALALLALVAGPRFVDWKDQRDRVTAFIEERTGMPVRIGGTLSLSLLPTVEFDAGEVEIGPVAAPIARAERLTFSLSPLALLRGQITFTAARADRVSFSRSAAHERLMFARNWPESGRLMQVGFDSLELTGVRLVENIESGVPLPPGQGVLDLAIEAPNLLGPYRVQASDVGKDREFRAQIGRLEQGRARLKGVIEDRGLGSRVSLDGWFGMPGVAGRPVFDGAAAFNGNPVLGGKDGAQLPFSGTARLMAYSDQVIADPLNLAFGNGDSAFQVAGQGFADLKTARPEIQLRLGAKRLDAQPLMATEPGSAQAEGVRQVRWLLAQGAGASLPFDVAVEFSLGQVQLPGANVQNIAFKAGIGAKGFVLDQASAELPGQTRAFFQRAEQARAAPLDGALRLEAEALQVMVGWLRGGEPATQLPARASLVTHVASNGVGIALSGLRIDSAAGSLTGSGEWLPAEAGKRASPRLSLDLAAERFDARVLAALDPLRPVPGLALATRLAVQRLVLDGQEMGGLQVALDRDGQTATLRQLRLTGRKGEEISLAGTASGETLQMTAKLDAERLGDIAQLSRALLPGEATEAFVQRAALLEPAIAVANFRAVIRPNEATWDVVVDGKLGGSTLVGKSQSALKGADLTVTVEADIANLDGTRLFGQLAGRALSTAGKPVPGRIALRAEGNPRKGITGTLTGALAGVDLVLDGGVNPFRITPLEGRLTLVAKDISVLGTALGGGVPGLERGGEGRIAARLMADRSKITLANVDASFSDTPVTGEVSFDLTRGGQVAGRLMLARLALPGLLGPVVGKDWPIAATGWSSEAFGTPVTPPLSGDLWIEAKQASLAEGITLGETEFVLRFSPGSVGFEGFEAKAGEVRLDGSLAFQRKGDSVEVGGKLDLARVPLPALGGRVSGTLPLTGSGENPLAFVSSLSGAGKVSLDEMLLGGADPQALGRVTALSLDDLAPINENRIGGLVDQELKKGDLRLQALEAPLGLINGQVRVAMAPRVLDRTQGIAVTVTPAFSLDLVRREGEAKVTVSQPVLPKDWTGAVPEIGLALAFRSDGKPPQRRLQVASLVNGFLAMAIQRDLERAEAFEADTRERAAQLRRQRADAWLERRNRELQELEAAIEVEAAALKRRAEREKAEREAAELAATLKALELNLMPKEVSPKDVPVTPPASLPPLDLTPKAPPG